MNCVMVSLSVGSVFSRRRISYLASSETSDHSGLGKPYWPRRILLFIPGEMAWPVLE